MVAATAKSLIACENAGCRTAVNEHRGRILTIRTLSVDILRCWSAREMYHGHVRPCVQGQWEKTKVNAFVSEITVQKMAPRLAIIPVDVEELWPPGSVA